MQPLEQTAPARTTLQGERRKSIDAQNVDRAAAKIFRASPNVYSFTDKDGTTILHVERDKMYSVIGVGSLIWSKIKAQSAGVGDDIISASLAGEFQNIPRQQIERDVARTLRNFQTHGFVQTGESRRDGLAQTLRDQILNGFLWAARAATHLLLKLRLYTIAAFLGLAAINLILKLVSFRAFYQIVKRWPTSRSCVGFDATRLVREAVDRATVLYPKQAMCLQRSAVATCLLRSCGSPAEMVIGCRKIPFKSHAWAELFGQVVNDRPKVQELYRVLDRC